ncbi:phosphatidate cytidylyltransferase [Ornithinimicrobium sp. Arc0846-15]|nr:phosphatidate cytidylyltransferase [Ornithinimicrobium laminariae]
MTNAPTSRRAYRNKRRAEDLAARENTPSRAGRNLPAAIGVGVGLVLVIMVSLFFWKPAFVIVLTAAAALAVTELIEALKEGRVNVPYVPVMGGTLVLGATAYIAGTEGLAGGFALACLLVLVWRASERGEHALRDVAGGVFVLAYVPLLAGIAVLMVAEDDGPARVLTFILVTIASDTGGYMFGVLWGKRPMAPSLSPKKSWEGFTGSVVWSVAVGIAAVVLLLDGSWLVGVMVGVAAACFATIGDLAESTLKRDLGIKDMGSILPGHGGIMDRMDSLLVVVPVTWALLTIFVPV